MTVRDRKKVVVGMSGGVDSSVAAAMLAEQGYEVEGVSLNILTCDREKAKSCCAPNDREDARAVCERLGLRHRVVDCRARFKEAVIEPFISEYLAGRTPSPCILCNHLVKFPALIEEADRLGASHIATGHYARIMDDAKLAKGVDEGKDQSYFLFGLNRQILLRTIFPLGDLTKREVRRIANEKGLKTQNKPESQEVCFVPDDDYAAFLESRASERIKGPGNFVDEEGKIVGRHRGIHAYTIGQRRGLGFGIGRRQYVVGINKEGNEVVLGEDGSLLKSELVAGDVNWISGHVQDVKDVTVKIRSTHVGERASLEMIGGNRVRVRFKSPVCSIAPGQAAVFYDNEIIIGGGWIDG